MLKKTMLLAAMAVAATALFAPSAGATDAKWRHGANPLAANATFQATSVVNGTDRADGKVALTAKNGLGGVACHVTITVQLTGNTSTGHLTQFATANCVAFGGLAMTCGQQLQVEATGGQPQSPVGWTIHGTTTATGQGTLNITNPIIHSKFANAPMPMLCPDSEGVKDSVTVTGGEVGAIADNPNAAKQLTLEGSAQSSIGEMEATGTFEILGAAKGTYGVM